MTETVEFGHLFSEPLRNGVSYSSKLRGTGVPMINMKEIFAYDRIGNVECELAPLTDKERNSYLLQGFDLLFARQSLTYEGAGKCSIVLPIDCERTWESHLIRVRLDLNVANPEYYYYYFRSPHGRRNVETIVQQVAAAGIRGSDLARLKVPKPPISHQQAIAEVLGALDDKIAANSRLSVKIDQFLAAIFTRVTEDSSSITLGEIANVNPETHKPVKGGYLRYIDISSVGQGTFEFPEISPWDDAPSRARRHVQSGDTLWSTVRPNRRSHALNLSDDELLVGSTGLAVLRPRDIGFAYLYEATKTPAFTAYLENVAEGSAYPAVRTNRFEDAPISWATTAERDSFEITAAPLRRTQHSLDRERLRLAAVRDALLPQFMSGKLRVKQAEEFLSAVV